MKINEQQYLFKNAVKKLEVVGFNNPLLEFQRLLDYSIGNHSINNRSNPLVDKYIEQVFKFSIRRRLSHEPISQIVGYRHFWKSRFFVNKNVLDPRPETELIVEKVLEISSQNLSLLDLGTGTGCLAISIALERPSFKITASDISCNAIRVAKVNAKNLKAKLKFIKSDWFSKINQKFDIIISNPPYICERDLLSLPLSIQRFEPRIALGAGKYGLDCITEIVVNLNDHLNSEGIGIFEIGINQQEMVQKLLKSHGFNGIEFLVDLSGKERVVCVKKDA